MSSYMAYPYRPHPSKFLCWAGAFNFLWVTDYFENLMKLRKMCDCMSNSTYHFGVFADPLKPFHVPLWSLWIQKWNPNLVMIPNKHFLATKFKTPVQDRSQGASPRAVENPWLPWVPFLYVTSFFRASPSTFKHSRKAHWMHRCLCLFDRERKSSKISALVKLTFITWS